MERTNEQYGQICRYVNGEMNEKESDFFEALLNRDESLRSEVEAHRELERLCGSALQKLEEKLDDLSEKKNYDPLVLGMLEQARKDWEETNSLSVGNAGPVATFKSSEEKHKSGVLKMGRPVWLAAAVLLGILCVAAVVYFQKAKDAPLVAQQPANVPAPPSVAGKMNETHPTKPLPPPDLRALFAANFEPDAPPLTRDKRLTEPLALYKAKNYSQAITAFNNAEATLALRSANDADIRTPFYVYYYRAQAQLAAQKSLSQSITDLKRALKVAKDPEQKRKAQWYLALACLKKGDDKDAKKYLSALGAGNNEYRQKATELAVQLNAN